jgi:hypothetical protein
MWEKYTEPPKPWGAEHITPSTMKLDKLLLKLFKTGQITP